MVVLAAAAALSWSTQALVVLVLEDSAGCSSRIAAGTVIAGTALTSKWALTHECLAALDRS